MTPSKQVKKAGLKSLKQVSDITGQSPQTLHNWYTHKRDLFDVVVLGCLVAVASDDTGHTTLTK